jgi:carboxylesterase
MTIPVLEGAEPWSHASGAEIGVLTLHGFTGNPSSMRPVALGLAAGGFDVELPRLPGHGTTVDDMLTTSWDDWTGEVEKAYQRLAGRVGSVVVAGLSMGGSLTLWTGLQHPDVAGLICVNPATKPQPTEVLAMLDEMLADGTTLMPGIGSDLADPDAVELAYEGTPVGPLLSLQRDGLLGMADRYGELTMPLRLFTSRQDHVVEPSNSEHLAATYGGPVEHTWLDRSYHVATQDYDRDLIIAESVAFAGRVGAAA